MQRTVFKLGGSLLKLPDLHGRIARRLSDRPDEHRLLVVGGGAIVDVVRDWDRTHELGDQRAHDLALDAMELSRTLVCGLLPSAFPVNSVEEAEAVRTRDGMAVLDARRFASASSDVLPASWDVTSDTIAAAAAVAWRADELVLLKSCPLSTAVDWPTAAERGLVDRWFPRIAESIPKITWVEAR